MEVSNWRETFKKDPEQLETYVSSGFFSEEVYAQMLEYIKMSDKDFVEQVRLDNPDIRITLPPKWSEAKFNDLAQPVLGISFFEARAYCAWLSAQTGHAYRLPDELEWEFAARGKEGRAYAYGDAHIPWSGNTVESHIQAPSPVGIFSEGDTPEGISDMAGNCGNWTMSTEDGKTRLKDGVTMKQLRPDDNYAVDTQFVIRGGSWGHTIELTGAVFRNFSPPAVRNAAFGFRLACDLTQAKIED